MWQWKKMGRLLNLRGSVRTVDTHTKTGKAASCIAREKWEYLLQPVPFSRYTNVMKIAACIFTREGSMLTVRY